MNKPINVRVTNELKNPTEPGVHYRLLCMTGPNKGMVYYLIGKRAIIGRSEVADIQIVDTKISREHAELSFAGNGYTVTDLGAQNGIIVNDKKISQKKLADNEKMVIGQTVFKYNIIEVSNSDVAVIVNNDLPVAPIELIKQNKGKISKKPTSFSGNEFEGGKKINTSEKNSGPRMLVISCVVIIVLIVLFSKDDTPKQSTTRHTGSINDIEKDFNLPKSKNKSPDDVVVKRKLENYIHSGRREFSEGNYFRAMEDFRLALLLSPNDGHASFYLSKAKQNLDDDIRKNLEKGRQEQDSKKLQAAIVSFCGVVQLIQNYPDDERYKNAMLSISTIESELGLEKGEVKCFEAKPVESKN